MSIRAAATRKSLLYSIASRTSASSAGSLNDVSQPSTVGAATPPCAVHCGGVLKFGTACARNSATGGGCFSAQPASAIETMTTALRTLCIASMQLEDQVVQVGPDADDDLADDMEH